MRSRRFIYTKAAPIPIMSLFQTIEKLMKFFEELREFEGTAKNLDNLRVLASEIKGPLIELNGHFTAKLLNTPSSVDKQSIIKVFEPLFNNINKAIDACNATALAIGMDPNLDPKPLATYFSIFGDFPNLETFLRALNISSNPS